MWCRDGTLLLVFDHDRSGQLLGQGVKDASAPHTYDKDLTNFGSVVIGQNSEKALTLNNSGTGDLTFR